MLDFFGRWAEWGPVFLRLIGGAICIGCGYSKLSGAQPGLRRYARALQILGFSPPLLWAYVGGTAEFLAGVCLVVGFATRLAALVMAVGLMVIMFRVKWTKRYQMAQANWTLDWAGLSIMLSLLVTGPGRLALDHRIPTGF